MLQQDMQCPRESHAKRRTTTKTPKTAKTEEDCRIEMDKAGRVGNEAAVREAAVRETAVRETAARDAAAAAAAEAAKRSCNSSLLSLVRLPPRKRSKRLTKV